MSEDMERKIEECKRIFEWYFMNVGEIPICSDGCNIDLDSSLVIFLKELAESGIPMQDYLSRDVSGYRFLNIPAEKALLEFEDERRVFQTPQGKRFKIGHSYEVYSTRYFKAIKVEDAKH